MKPSFASMPISESLKSKALRRRKTSFAFKFLLFSSLLPASLFAERQPYERYTSIVDRQMFGPLPANFDPTKSPADVSKNANDKSEKELTQEQEKVKSAIRFSVINVTPEGDTAIGFTDNSNAKNPVHYYLKVGESRNGWLVKEADAKTATMTIEKEGVEVTLSLGGDSASGDGKTEKNTPATLAAVPAAHRSSILSAATTLGSRRRLRREREEAEERMNEEARKKLADERAKLEAEREQREAEHQKEREETRAALQQLQEELRKTREQNTQSAQQKQGEGAASSEGEAEGNNQ